MDEANKLMNEYHTGMQKAVDEINEIKEYNLGNTGMVNGSTGKGLKETAKFYLLLSNRQGLNIVTINHFS